MKKSGILWAGLLVLGLPTWADGQVTCDELGSDKIQKQFDKVLEHWEKPSANKETAHLFVELRKHAQPEQTTESLDEAQAILKKLKVKPLGGDSKDLTDDMNGLCKQCLESIRSKYPTGSVVSPTPAPQPVVAPNPVPTPQGGKTNAGTKTNPLPEPSLLDWLLYLSIGLLTAFVLWANRKSIARKLDAMRQDQPLPKTTLSNFPAGGGTPAVPQKPESEELALALKKIQWLQGRVDDLENRVNYLHAQNVNREPVEQAVERYLLERAEKTDALLVKPVPVETAAAALLPVNGFTNVDAKQGVFFMPSPSQDGTFSVSNQNEVCRPGFSIYRFEVLPGNPNQAEFILIDSPETLRRILNLIETYVEPVCTSINGYLPDAKRIFTVGPGLAERQDDRWVIKEKAEIKYV